MTGYGIAALAGAAMFASDAIATVMVMEESRGHGWTAGLLDTMGWYVAITTTTISVTALQGHNLTEKILVIAFVSTANLIGTKFGQVMGSWLTKRQEA